jgi:hypothetical protein
MLRHACGYALANKGHDTRAIQGWLVLRPAAFDAYGHGAARVVSCPLAAWADAAHSKSSRLPHGS